MTITKCIYSIQVIQLGSVPSRLCVKLLNAGIFVHSNMCISIDVACVGVDVPPVTVDL